MQTDFLIIGSGLAGLNYAIKVAKKHPDKQIIAITKSNEGESNTKYAQGGIAVVHSSIDSFDKHIKDTLIAGDGLCDEAVVRLVISKGPECLKGLSEIGVEFDKDTQGNLDLGKEGGHSRHRVIHFQDTTGSEIERALIATVKKLTNVTLLEHHFALDLITNTHSTAKNHDPTCYGAFVLNQRNNKIISLYAKITLLASGGIGQIYGHTTNPLIATGDGIAMAYRADAEIRGMEFIQFHPTALFDNDVSPAFLISEAVRGFGAKLKTTDGRPFMHQYDDREELASRDIVTRAIVTELKRSGDLFVYLDCTHLDEREFNSHFPNISEKCKSIGIHPSRQMIPVVPAQHYLCGGIHTNSWGETNIQNLFACGECAHTGLHGANRLASNSLLEAYVLSSRCADRSSQLIDSISINQSIHQLNSQKRTSSNELILIAKMRSEVQDILWNYVGILRSTSGLQFALKQLDVMRTNTELLFARATVSTQLYELRNMITVAYIITQQSLFRTENKGGFFNLDF